MAGSGVGRTEIEPQHPVVAQHPAHLPEHLHHLRHILLWRSLLAELPRDFVIALPPVRRRGHDTMDARGGQFAEDRQNIPVVEGRGIVLVIRFHGASAPASLPLDFL